MKLFINGIKVELNTQSNYKIVTNDDTKELYVYEFDVNQDFNDDEEIPKSTLIVK